MLVVLRVNESPPFSWGIFISALSGLISVMHPRVLLLYILCFALEGKAQTLGGQAVYGFLQLQWHPQPGALGGRNVSLLAPDLGGISENPALLDSVHHAQVSSSFTFLAPGITGLYAVGAFEEKKSRTRLALGITQLFYGTVLQTDAAGNQLGAFRAVDQVVAVTATRAYGARWQYGASVKLINSRYGAFSSLGLAADAGLSYHNPESQFRMGFAAKNMGIQLRSYAGQQEDLPFDMVLGISKGVQDAPFRLSLTAQKIHQWDLLYNDTLFLNENQLGSENSGFGTKLISHVIAGTEILIGDKIVFSAGYNFLRRRELRIRDIASGLTGFSYGLTLSLQRLRFQFSRAHYQTALSQNQVSISYQLKSPY